MSEIIEHKRDSMVFYRSFYEALKELPLEQKGVIYDAIFEYSLNFNEIELSGLNSAIFTLIKPQLEANNKKYIKGKKGGAPIGNKNAAKNNLEQPNVNGNANENVNKNVNEYYVSKGFDLRFIEEDFAEAFSKWLEYKIEIKDSYNVQRSLETAYNNLKKISNDNPAFAEYIVERSISNQWRGLFEVDDENVLKRFENNPQHPTKPQGEITAMNEIEIRKALDILKPVNKLDGKQPIIEVRVIGNKTYSGYFRDIDKLIEAIKPYNNDNIYFTVNEIDEACYSREQCEKILQSGNRTKTTSDSDISARDYILIDIDPKRASGVSANDEEINNARNIGRKVYNFLKSQGFPKPVSAFSGNGFHFLYKVDLANSSDNTELVKSFLQTLDMLFSDETVDIDTSVFNASRITKLYGTYSRKGANTEDRPHRISQILSIPDRIELLDKAFIQKVVKLLPKEEPKTWQNNYQGSGHFDLDEFIAKHGIDIKKRVPFGNGEKLIVDCIFDSNHKGDGAIFRLNNGAIGYKCFHNSCQMHSWSSFREHFEPNRNSRSGISYNRYSGTRPTELQNLKPQTETEDKGKKFQKFSEIKEKDRSSIISIPTGFAELDSKIIGLNLGELSIVSGINGSGKSAVIKQIGLNAVNANYNILEYSGELDSTRSKSWTMLQAAGRVYTEPTRYENYYRVPERISNLISEWIDGRWLIYNNDYSNNLSQLIVDIEEQITNRETHLVIVDNIMSLELSDLGGDKYDNQKKAVWELKQLAMKHKVHVVVVAHPRKSMGFLRKEDIAGSGDMINLAENIFIVHRVNNDFRKRFPEFYGEDKAAPYMKYGNVLEVAKNRDLGIIDHFVGVHYEIESKRFLNDFTDTPYYGWQDLLEQNHSDTYLGIPDMSFEQMEKSFLSEPLSADQLPF